MAYLRMISQYFIIHAFICNQLKKPSFPSFSFQPYSAHDPFICIPKHS